MSVVSYRQPRAAISLNGTTISDAVHEFDVHSNNYFAADTFRVRLALSALPRQFGAAFWSDTQAKIGISVDAGNGPLQLMLGMADAIDLNIPSGFVEASGRDLSAAFIDTKVFDKFQNLTSSQIAEQLATGHGLKTNIVATSTPSGRYYEIDHARLACGISEWTLLNYLAQEEGFDVYVSGDTLNFLPSAQSGAATYALAYQPPTAGRMQNGNFMRLDLRRSQTLARGVVVKVISWNSKSAAAITATAKRNGVGGSPFNDSAQLYTYKIPGLTQDQAQRVANAKLDEISKHERLVDVTVPGETGLTPRQQVTLSGTDTSFDQSYYIDAIDRSMSVEDGFVQTIRMKNHSPESTVSA